MPKYLPLWTVPYPGLQYYECSAGNTHKYWAIWKVLPSGEPGSQSYFKTFWGRIGKNPTTKEKGFWGIYARDVQFDNIIQQKLMKGYGLKGTVKDPENPPLTFPSLGKQNTIKPGVEHKTPPAEVMDNILDVLELE